MDTKNEVWALHLDGKLIHSKKKILVEERKHSYYTQFTKCFYSSEAKARYGRRFFPDDLRDRIEIVKYIPEGSK